MFSVWWRLWTIFVAVCGGLDGFADVFRKMVNIKESFTWKLSSLQASPPSIPVSVDDKHLILSNRFVGGNECLHKYKVHLFFHFPQPEFYHPLLKVISSAGFVKWYKNSRCFGGGAFHLRLSNSHYSAGDGPAFTSVTSRSSSQRQKLRIRSAIFSFNRNV